MYKYKIKFRRRDRNKKCKNILKVICICYSFSILKNKDEKDNIIYVGSKIKENIYEMKNIFNRKLFKYGNILEVKEI